MKISTFLLMVLTGIAVYGIWSQKNAEVPAPAAPIVVPVYPKARTPVPATPHPAVWQRGELQQVHGKVVEVNADGLVVACTWYNEEGSLKHFGHSPEAHRNAREYAAQMDEREYGRLMCMEGGVYRAASFTPDDRASTTILLVGHPLQAQLGVGSLVNVVAAPLPNLVYTMHYELAADRPGNWMWQGKTSLDIK